MCFLTTLLNGNPVSDASEVRHANIWLSLKWPTFWGSLMLPKVEIPISPTFPLSRPQAQDERG